MMYCANLNFETQDIRRYEITIVRIKVNIIWITPPN